MELNDSAVKILGDEKLQIIARELRERKPDANQIEFHKGKNRVKSSIGLS